MNDTRDESWERRLDLGLREIEGGATPPDVTDAVLERIERDLLVFVATERSRHRRALPSRWIRFALLGGAKVEDRSKLERIHCLIVSTCHPSRLVRSK